MAILIGIRKNIALSLLHKPVQENFCNVTTDSPLDGFEEQMN